MTLNCTLVSFLIDMDSKDIICRWGVDCACHVALCEVFSSEVFDLQSVVSCLVDAVNVVCRDTIILDSLFKLLNSLEDHVVCSNALRRTVLICIAVRICTITQSDFEFALPKNATKLEGILYLIKGMLKLGFVDCSETILEMQCLTVFLMVQQFESAQEMDKVNLVMAEYEKDLQDARMLLKEMKEADCQGTQYMCYIQTMLKKIAVVNSTLGKPFIIQLADRVNEHRLLGQSKCVSKKSAQHFSTAIKALQATISKQCKKCPGMDPASVGGSGVMKSVIQSEKNPVQKLNVPSTSSDVVQTTSLCPVGNACVDNQAINNDENESLSGLSVSNTESSSTNFSRRWSPQLDSYIIAGVKKFGNGEWCKIHHNFPFPADKDNRHIKDRWRTMLKNKLVEIDSSCKVVDFNNIYTPHIESANNLLQKCAVRENDVASPGPSSVFAVHKQPVVASVGVSKGKVVKRRLAKKKHYRKVFF